MASWSVRSSSCVYLLPLGVIGEGRVVSSCKVAESFLLFSSVPCTGSVLVPLDIRPEMVVQLGFGAGGGATRFYGGLHLVFAGVWAGTT